MVKTGTLQKCYSGTVNKIKGNLYTNAKKQLYQAAELLKIDAKTVKLLEKPQRVIKKTLRVKMDNGKFRSFRAFRSQHCDVLGPYKGGIRFHPRFVKG